MGDYYSSRELRILDIIAEKVLDVIIQEDFRISKGTNWPKVFSDYAQSAYSIAEEMLVKRRYYSEKNPCMKHTNN
jgi:hypothetical protein